MTQVAGKFRCPNCGVAFTWKPEYAGKNVRCNCGFSFQPPAEAAPARAVAAQPSGIGAVAARYPHRMAKPVSEEQDPAERASFFRDVVLPLALIAAGLALRISQLVYANEGNGNRWSGNVTTPPGVGKSILLVTFEMSLAAAMM